MHELFFWGGGGGGGVEVWGQCGLFLFLHGLNNLGGKVTAIAVPNYNVHACNMQKVHAQH